MVDRLICSHPAPNKFTEMSKILKKKNFFLQSFPLFLFVFRKEGGGRVDLHFLLTKKTKVGRTSQVNTLQAVFINKVSSVPHYVIV